MQLFYIVKRFGVFLLIVWLAATLNFFLPKLSGQDPVRTKLLRGGLARRLRACRHRGHGEGVPGEVRPG